jgi:hypothetical protein
MDLAVSTTKKQAKTPFVKSGHPLATIPLKSSKWSTSIGSGAQTARLDKPPV